LNSLQAFILGVVECLTEFLPLNLTRIPIQISESSDTDLEKLEKVVFEEVESFAKEDGRLLLEPAPTLRFIPGLGDNSIVFTLYVFVSDYERGFFVENELKKII
jgi:small-conductance mechanosensitive channel